MYQSNWSPFNFIKGNLSQEFKVRSGSVPFCQYNVVQYKMSLVTKKRDVQCSDEEKQYSERESP